MDTFISLEESQGAFDELFEKLKTDKTYTKVLSSLAKTRSNMIGSVHITTFCELLNEHIKKTTDILSERKVPDRRINMVISKSLTPLESRLLMDDNCSNAHIQADEIEKFAQCLKLHINHPKHFEPYTDEKFINNFYHYGIALLTLNNLLDIYLFNPYKFHNVIYVNLPKSKEDDPFSFYTLSQIKDNKRYWAMDCRLECFASNMIGDLCQKFVNQFRIIYNNIFGDNVYRNNFTEKCQLAECDCCQLANNILQMAKPRQFCIMLQKKVIQKATYIPTDDDKFNLRGDDTIQRQEFHKNERILEEEEELYDVIRSMFDGITKEDAEIFYQDRIT